MWAAIWTVLESRPSEQPLGARELFAEGQCREKSRAGAGEEGRCMLHA